MYPFKYSVVSSVSFYLFMFLLFSTEAAPIYSSHYCTDSIRYQPNSTFQTNLNLILSYLSSNATEGKHFYTTRVGSDSTNKIQGLFLCRGDTLTTTCYNCITAASKAIKRLCPIEKEAIIWYDLCMLRYSNQSLNNIVPGVDLSDSKSIALQELVKFNELLSGLLNALATKAENSTNDKKFATGEVNFTRKMKLYGLVECTPDLSLFNCNMCLRSAIASVPNCCDGKQGARVLLPGCNIRYDLYPFYNITNAPILTPRRVGRDRDRVDVILTFAIPIVAAMVLFTFGICSVMREQARNMIQLCEKSVYDAISFFLALQVFFYFA